MKRWGTAPIIAVSVVVACLGLALVISNGSATQAVTANARHLHWVNSVLGSAGIARAGNSQAVVFAVDHDLGVASDEALEVALTEARATLTALNQTISAKPEGLANAEEALDASLSGFVTLNEDVLGSIEEGAVLDAVDLAQNELETAYQELEDVLLTEQARLSGVIEESEGALARMASIASALVTLLIPATAVVIYFLLVRRQLRDKRIAMDAELEAERELSRAKDEFIGGLSHELRTPLTSIYGFSEVLLETGMLDPRQTMELISLINTESADLSRMVEDLLTAARIEADALSYDIGEVALVSELDTVMAPFRRAGVSITASCPPLTVLADKLRLRQVLRNLISNAIRHGGPNVRIDARDANGVLQLAVIDDGPGVAPDVVDRLFEPYVHEGRAALLAGSVGLGLAIVKSLLDAMGGTIAYSRVEGHTVFGITLPLAERGQLSEQPLVVVIDGCDRHDAFQPETSRSAY